MQSDVTPFHNGPSRDGELPATGIALEAAGPVFLAEHSRNLTLASRAAVSANRAIGPNLRLEPFAGEVVILKGRVVEIGKHLPSLPSIRTILPMYRCFV